mmetsp:Transcript_82482/g.191614  ORF Transcript_82482/g.191614 Transcript_82482/m.191614 type:complete len:269 (+) Transcript_82482:17-823(+)
MVPPHFCTTDSEDAYQPGQPGQRGLHAPSRNVGASLLSPGGRRLLAFASPSREGHDEVHRPHLVLILRLHLHSEQDLPVPAPLHRLDRPQRSDGGRDVRSCDPHRSLLHGPHERGLELQGIGRFRDGERFHRLQLRNVLGHLRAKPLLVRARADEAPRVQPRRQGGQSLDDRGEGWGDQVDERHAVQLQHRLNTLSEVGGRGSAGAVHHGREELPRLLGRHGILLGRSVGPHNISSTRGAPHREGDLPPEDRCHPPDGQQGAVQVAGG